MFGDVCDVVRLAMLQCLMFKLSEISSEVQDVAASRVGYLTLKIHSVKSPFSNSFHRFTIASELCVNVVL